MIGNLVRNVPKFAPSCLNFAFYSSGAKKVAVVLSGSGVYDGSEIHEAAYVLAHITCEGARPLCYAPDVPQLHVINHLKGSPEENHTRNVLVESARIARGSVQPLSSLQVGSADAVVFPGGFGAAKNLSDFALKGAECTVLEDVTRILNEFHEAKKPIGLCCIAPVLAAKVLKNVTVTLGKNDDSGKWPHSGAIEQVQKMGASVEFKNVNEISFDAKNNVITTPAFMCEATFHEIYEGIGCMIKELIRQIK